MAYDNLLTLPQGLPLPVDDGAADHLAGKTLPHISLAATGGVEIDLSSVPGLAAIFAYPRTGRPGQEPLTPDWDAIPGARGCTPQTCAFRDLAAEFASLNCRIFGLSTQDHDYQQELADRLHLPFPVLSDARLELSHALGLPTMEVAGLTLLRRLTWVARDGIIIKVFYPVFPPDRNAGEVLDYLRKITALASA
jgi:peroxiredoxin